MKSYVTYFDIADGEETGILRQQLVDLPHLDDTAADFPTEENLDEVATMLDKADSWGSVDISGFSSTRTIF